MENKGKMSEASTSVYPCRVCGDKASGLHYGVLCCEGCKGFFFRTIRCNKRYRVCEQPSNCLILKSNRSLCKFCRMQRCLELGMSYEAVRMGRRPKTDREHWKQTLVSNMIHNDDLMLEVYSAYQKACKYGCLNNNVNDQLNNESRLDVVGGVFVRNGITLSTTFAKQIESFTALARETQRRQIKLAVIEMSVLFESVRNETEPSDNFTTYSSETDVSVLTVIRNNGRTVSNKLLSLNLTPAELSLLFGLILFCSDRQSLDSSERKKVECKEELALSALKYQLVLNHRGHRKLLPQVIEIICCLRGLTSQYLDDLLGIDVT